MAETADLNISTQPWRCTEFEGNRLGIDNLQVIPNSWGGAWVIATDGRRAVFVSVSGSCDRLHYMPAKILKATKEQQRMAGGRVRARCIDGFWTTSFGMEAQEPTPVKFPNFLKNEQMMFPLTEGRSAVMFDASYLFGIQRALSHRDDYNSVTLFFDPNNPSEPLVIKAGDGFATLMPIRMEHDGDPPKALATACKCLNETRQAFLADYRKAMESVTVAGVRLK